MKIISIKDFDNIRIGNAQNTSSGTGCTVIISENGMCAGLDVRGGGPASRESELLKPLAAADRIHAVLLGGGSAFGLDAAGGVMQFLEEKGIGLDVGIAKVPLVCQSDIFDLTVADPYTRPDKAMGYEACVGAWQNNYQDGCFGVGTGATIGKLNGMEHCMKSGIGSYAVQIGELKIGAIVAVNALGIFMIITMVRSSPACSLMTRNLLLILHSFFTGHMTSTKTNLWKIPQSVRSSPMPPSPKASSVKLPA